MPSTSRLARSSRHFRTMISFRYWPRSEADRQLLARRTLSTNWTSLFFAPSIPFSSTSSFVLTSLLYHSIVNYSLLSTFLAFDRSPLLILLSVLSRLSLILTRLYACVFLFRLNTWWLPMTFLMVHLTLILTLLCDRSKLASRRFTIFIQMVFSFVTHSSIDDRSINVLISLENISIFLHRLYLETYIDGYHQRTVRLITFLSVLIGLQVIGLLLDILTKALLERLAKRKTKHWSNFSPLAVFCPCSTISNKDCWPSSLATLGDESPRMRFVRRSRSWEFDSDVTVNSSRWFNSPCERGKKSASFRDDNSRLMAMRY